MNTEVLTAMIELLKTLPTRDFEFSFLADYFMVFSQIIASHKNFPQVANMQLLVNRISDALRYHLVPFLIESGYQFIAEGENEAQFNPRVYFISRFIELINSLVNADLFLQQTHRLSSGI
jgi:hypothetical protein